MDLIRVAGYLLFALLGLFFSIWLAVDDCSGIGFWICLFD